MAKQLKMFKAKVHRATVTHGDVDYEGSVTISGELMEAAGILEYEQVHVWNITRGTRLVSYAIRGDDNSGIICMNGAAAHLAAPGEKIIIATFADVDESEAGGWKPTVVLVDETNRAVAGDHTELAGPKRRTSAAS